MRNVYTLVVVALLSFNATAQTDWELPMENGKIRFEFNSKKLNSGNKDVCELYTSTNTMVDLNGKLTDLLRNGRHDFWTASSFQLAYQLYNADASIGNLETMAIKCSSGDDTLIGSLTINITNITTKDILLGTGPNGGTIKCLYRIVLKDDSYNIKLQGFKYSYIQTYRFKAPESITITLEEEYSKRKVKKNDKLFWKDIKWIIEAFHKNLETVLSSQGSDFNFDD